VEACPDEHKSLLNENLKYWNGLSFRNRLKELFAPYKRYFKGYDSIDILIGQVVNTRNYYTHFDPSSEGAAITEGQALWKINNLLELLFELHLLSLLGFSESQIETIVHESERLKQKMHS
ncbi:MAG: hypothetical protein OEZ04_01290, partial [Nitrospinota bacterium]|nr:hypothetical protein [Nitrospinota bacterium]